MTAAEREGRPWLATKITPSLWRNLKVVINPHTGPSRNRSSHRLAFNNNVTTEIVNYNRITSGWLFLLPWSHSGRREYLNMVGYTLGVNPLKVRWSIWWSPMERYTMLFVTRLQISQSTHHKLKMLASTNMHMEQLLLRQPSLVDSNHVNKKSL